MRKNSPRKWLHAILDLVPVILIPVFMIYSHRHVLTDSTDVEIQYKYQSNEVNNVDDIVLNNIYYCDTLYMSDDYNCEFTINVLSFSDTDLSFRSSYDFDEVYFDSLDYDDYYLKLYMLVDGDMGCYSYFTNNDCYVCLVVYDTFYLEDCIFYVQDGLSDFKNFLINTQVGANGGNLPQYTDFNIIENVDVVDTNSTITSAFLNNFNGTIQNYFNFGNTFNFQSIWSWINTNIFLGNAPQIIYSIWCIVCYEFLVDLLFIFYSFFMFLIDFCECLLEKPFNKINRGK